ncbi:cytochrome P450 [Oxyplasma meridianum]|uniref:Cytochrome P450 n=1 Tax=Oxyplasma meridianum TaxID=3073602 RepID=A0AAX4NFZ6_9ARCH
MEEMKRDLLNPFPWYKAMRTSKPVFRDSEYGLWNVFRYEDVKRVLSNFKEFSSQFGKAFNPAGGPISESIINLDPPRHTKLRNIVSRAFTPRSVEKMEPAIREICENLLSVHRDGKFDIVKEYTSPLPVTVIATMLGIPVKDMNKFKRWSDNVVGGSESNYAEFPAIMKEMIEYFRKMMVEREKEPRDDLITAIINAEVDGDHLSELESLGFFILLLVAGNETTTNLISNSLLCFDENPGTMNEIRSDKGLIPRAIEEVLRYRSPVQSIYRVAINDTEINGVKVPAGSIMVPWIGSANRDESIFPDADSFDINRKENRHIAFGEGIHYCLGAPLARLEGKIALETLLEKYHMITIDRNSPIVPQDSTIVYGLKELTVKVS